MTPEILTNLGPTAAAVIIALAGYRFYNQSSDRFSASIDKFNTTIQNQMRDSNKINKDMALKMQSLSEVIGDQNDQIKNMATLHKESTEKLHIQLKEEQQMREKWYEWIAKTVKNGHDVKNIKITCKLEFGKTMIEESSSIRLKGEDDVITNN